MSFGRFTRQSSDSFAGPLNEARAVSTASGGTALSSTATVVGLANGTTHVSVIARNFAAAVVGKFALNPYLLLLVSTDQGASSTDYSDAGQNNPAGSGVVVDGMKTYANGGAFYIGSHVPFRGLAVVMSGSVNAVVSTLTVEFWNGSAWTAVAGKSDGTAAGGATLAQNGNITFTVPTTWSADYFANVVQTPFAAQPAQRGAAFPHSVRKNYWLRLTVSAALTASTTIAQAFALNRSTAYAEMLENSLMQFRVQKVPGGIAALELLTDAGSGNAIVNCYTDNPLGVF